MKLARVIVGMVLVLLGFTAGIALNTSSGIAAAAADPNPPAPLKTVVHDATLTGDGTAMTPLGLANGAVSFAKLSPSRLPSTGQVLGFDGAGLAWQNAPGSGPHIVDSLGHDVGPYSYGVNAGVIRQIGGVIYSLPGVGPAGFFNPGYFEFPHTTPDCSGTRYVGAKDDTSFITPTQSTGTQLIYAGPPIQQLTIHSVERLADPSGPIVECFAPFGFASVLRVGPPATLDLSSLGLTPPFHLQY